MAKVLLVGWDGAGWNRIHPLLDSGAMPNLARMVDNGVMGDLAPLTPLCSPLLWTSVATGQFADRHGILDTAEPDPVTGGVRPITRVSLCAPQIWDILAREGVRSQVTGWPATHPAQGPATCVSNGFAYGIPRTVYPPSLASKIEPLRFHPGEWVGEELSLFVPEFASIDQDKDKRLAKLAIVLARTVSVHAAATTLMESIEWDFVAVWFGAIGSIYEILRPGTDVIYREALPGVYRFLDLLLGRLLQLAGPEAVTLLVSDRAAGEPEWHDSTRVGSRGILCATGAQIKPDELTFGTGLLDISPTILSLFHFAAPPEMPGRILSEICPETPVRAVQAAIAVTAPVAVQPLLDRDLLELEALGYKDTVAAARRPEAEAASARRSYNLARVLLGQDRAAEAVPLLEEIATKNKDNLEFRLYLAHSYLRSGKVAECRVLCQALLAEHPDSPLAAISAAHLAIAEGNFSEAQEHLKAGRGVYGIAAPLDCAMGIAYLRTENWEEAATAFRSAIETDSRMPAAYSGLARAMLGAKRYEEAAESALDAVRLRYDLPNAHGILGAALRAMGREEAAAGAFAARETLLRRRAPAL